MLRDAMATDSLDPAGIYFGTRSGELFGSTDEGKNWKMILSGLPPVVCVKAVVVGEPRAIRKSGTGQGLRAETAALAQKKKPAAKSKAKRGKR